MKSFLHALLVSLPLFSQAAHADQCAVIPARSVLQAIDILERSPIVVRYCQACGDQLATLGLIDNVRAKLFSLETRAFLGAFRVGELRGVVAGLSVDADFTLEDFTQGGSGKTLDLAYVYVLDQKTQLMKNLGHLAGCRNSSPALLPERQSAQALLQLALLLAATPRR